jgi:hypothetical protein
MGNPYRPSHRLGLGDYRLRLDPEIEAQFRALQTAPPSPRLVNLVLRPSWRSLQQSTLDRMLLQPPTAPAPPLVPRGAGPATPRAGEVGVLMQAVWAVPIVQQKARETLDGVAREMGGDWRRASTGERVVVVTAAAVMGGGTLAGILSNNEARTAAFNFIVDRDLPVPGVDGLTVRLRRRGAAATYRNIGNAGVTVSAGAQQGAGGRVDFEVMITLDVTHYLRNW